MNDQGKKWINLADPLQFGTVSAMMHHSPLDIWQCVLGAQNIKQSMKGVCPQRLGKAQ